MLLVGIFAFVAYALEKPPGQDDCINETKKGTYEITLPIAIEDDADDAFIAQFSKRMQGVSDLIWKITHGQLYIREIGIRTKTSDGKIIIKKGTKNWEWLSGPNVMSGVAAQCLDPHTDEWFVNATGKAAITTLTHELFHGLFGLWDESSCRCIMLGAQIEGNEMHLICDDKTHNEGGKSCWAQLKERYPKMKHPNPAFDSKSKPPALKTTKGVLKKPPVVKEVKNLPRELSLEIGVQDAADDAFLDQFAKRMTEVSDLVWKITQGQFYIKEIKIRDNCSDGKVIIKKGTKDWDCFVGLSAVPNTAQAGPPAFGRSAMCYDAITSRWYAWSAGKPVSATLTAEILRGWTKLKYENCNCLLKPGQKPGQEIIALCDDKSHQGGGKSCWKQLLERYPQIKYPNPAFKPDSKPPAPRITKEHRKEPDAKAEQALNKKTELETAVAKYFDEIKYNNALDACNERLGLTPNDPWALYTLACVSARRMQQLDALNFVRKALENGFDDYEYMKQDPNLSNLRSTKEFQRLMEKY
ncbi:MAG: hypothetical protein HY762_03665 [Planctomycetes bacterium]|nr:hypothetical protein [Planctomycetota bacterium]